MAVTPVPSMTDIPPFPSLADRAAGTYNNKAFEFGAHMADTFNAELLEVANSVHNNAVDAAQSATTATEAKAGAEAARDAAATVAGASVFNPITNYSQYACAISPLDFLTYRRKTAGISATDPSLDATNWVPLTPKAKNPWASALAF